MNFKKLILTALAAFAMASLAAFGLRKWHEAALPPPPPPREALPEALVVYCFHDQRRGPNCRRMEKLAREVLEKDFAEQLGAGRLKFLLVNYQLSQHSFLIDEYDIEKPSIVLVDGRPGRQRQWKNLQEKVWKLLDDEKAFKDFIRDEVREALK